MTEQAITLQESIKENAYLKNEIAYLKEQLDWFKKQLFGQKTEKFVDSKSGQQLYFEGFDKIAPLEEKKLVKSHERVRRKPTGQDKISFPADIPIERHIFDLSEAEKVCQETGEALVKIGEEVTSKLAHKPGSYFIKQIIRPKYAYPKREEKGIAIADLPDTLLNRCQADESLLADILVKKYGDHLPLYRQAEIMAREKINISRQILCQWTMRSSVALKPLYDLMTTRLLESNNIFYDETPVSMLAPGKGKTQQAYMWVLVGGASANPSYRIYDFCTNRCHENAAKMLKDYHGVLHSDKYGAYETLANKNIWFGVLAGRTLGENL